MGANRRPFRVAFWALLSALGLSVVVHLTDPRSVRLALLANHETPAAHPNVPMSGFQLARGDSRPSGGRTPTPIADGDRAVHSRPPSLAESEHPRREAERGFAAAISKQHRDEPSARQGGSVAARSSADPRRSASARHVSSPFGGSTEGANVASIDRQGSMPILAPTHLQQNSVRGEYFELPPPPDWEREQIPRPTEVAFGPTRPDPQSLLSTPPAPSEEVDDHLRQDRFLQQRLDAEIAGLRREVERLAQTQHIGQQLVQLQRQTQQILTLHQQLPIDRLVQLLDMLLVQLQAVRATIPPQHETRSTTSGEGLQTEARLDELLRMLSALSDPSIVKAPDADSRAGLDRRASATLSPTGVKCSQSAPGESRSLIGSGAASQPSASQINPLESVETSDRTADADGAASTDWHIPVVAPADRSAPPPASKGPTQPVAAQPEWQRTVPASSCVDCHRAKGTR